MVWLATKKVTCAKAALPRHALSPPGAGVRNTSGILGQKVDFTRNVKVLYGFSDTSRYQ